MTIEQARDQAPERDLQAAVIDLAERLGWATYHVYDSRRSNSGFPDLVLLKGSRLIFAELKSAKGKLSRTQELWLARLRLVPGIEVYEWRPADWDAIAELLTKAPGGGLSAPGRQRTGGSNADTII
jgi:hypothetical protein